MRTLNIAVCITLLCAGCGAEYDQGIDIEQVEQATFRQSGCSTVSLADTSPYTHNRSEPIAPDSNCLGGQQYTSPTAGYTNGATCNNDYILEITGTYGRAFTPFISYASSMDQTKCQNGDYHLELTAWRYAPFAGWFEDDYAKYHSVWNGFNCSFALDAGYGGMSEIDTGTVVRLAGRAYFTSLGNPVAARVELGIEWGAPCF